MKFVNEVIGWWSWWNNELRISKMNSKSAHSIQTSSKLTKNDAKRFAQASSNFSQKNSHFSQTRFCETKPRMVKEERKTLKTPKSNPHPFYKLNSLDLKIWGRTPKMHF